MNRNADLALRAELETLSTEELNEYEKLNKERIESLENDIKLLKARIKQFGPDAIHRLKSSPLKVLHRPDGTSNIEEVQAKLDSDIARISDVLRKTSEVTGVTIDKVCRKVLEIDNSICKKQFEVDFRILEKPMKLDIEMDEKMVNDKDGPPQCDISWFEVQFEQDIDNAIGEEIRRYCDKLDMHPVFQLIKSYLLWIQKRDGLMRYFSIEHRKFVEVAQASKDLKIMKISNPNPQHPTFILEWDRKVKDARVEEDIRVTVDAAPDLLEKDAQGVLNDAPAMFSRMLKLYGLKDAIDRLINVVKQGNIGDASH